MDAGRISENSPAGSRAGQRKPHSRFDLAASGDAAAITFGVVIPTLNEAAVIGASVRDVLDEAAVHEVVVVDGGSGDATVVRARDAGARILRSGPGRGAQMKAGAADLRCDCVVFLHADCKLPAGAFDAMRTVLQRGNDAGLFAIEYDDPHPLLRLASMFSSLRVRWAEFGEGALFVRRARFQRLGGFPNWPLFEDVALLSLLRRAHTLGRARGRVRASARRYRQRGIARQLLLNAALYSLFHCGVPPRRLSQLYERFGRSSAHQRSNPATVPKRVPERVA